jgi:GntR family transcriptional regulator
MDQKGMTPPVYLQIAEHLLDQIESGKFRPGDRLPTERELSKVHKVNRMTVRRAFQSLEIKGLIDRLQGSGTYVAEPKIERQASVLISFTKGMQGRGYMPGAKLIRFERRTVEAPITQELELADTASIYRIHRLRLLNQEPVLLERLTLPVCRFPNLERFDLSKRSLYEVMEREYSISVVHARQSLKPVISFDYESELLEVRPGTPLMLEKRLTFEQDGQPVEYGRDLYRGDRFLFITDIAPMEF